MSGPTIFLDAETTGLHVDKRPWEIALITRTEGQPDVEDLFQVRDVDLSNADPFGLSVGKFYERHWAYADNPPRVAVVLESQLAGTIERLTRGATLVAANPAFDAAVLDAMLRRNGYLPAWHYRLIDVEALVAGHLHRIVGGLTKCAEALGITVDPAAEHTALGDARMVRAVWDAVMTQP